MRKKLTASIITKLQVPEGKRYVKVFDAEVLGLAVRKMASGVTTFIVERRPKGSPVAKQITIGRVAHYTVEQARIEGRKILAELSSNDYLAIAALKSSTPTFEAAVASYAKLELSGKQQSYIDCTLGTLRRYVTPKLGKIKISEIPHRNVPQIITQIMQDGKHPTAEMVWVSISNVLSWAVRFGCLDTNPLTGVKPKNQTQCQEAVPYHGRTCVVMERSRTLVSTTEISIQNVDPASTKKAGAFIEWLAKRGSSVAFRSWRKNQKS